MPSTEVLGYFQASLRDGTHVAIPNPALSPHVTRIVFDAVLGEEAQEFLLERLFPMMLLLLLNVCHRHVLLRNAQAECAVSFLPLEGAMLGERIMHPFRGLAFDNLNRLGDRERGRQ